VDIAQYWKAAKMYRIKNTDHQETLYTMHKPINNIDDVSFYNQNTNLLYKMHALIF